VQESWASIRSSKLAGNYSVLIYGILCPFNSAGDFEFAEVWNTRYPRATGVDCVYGKMAFGSFVGFSKGVGSTISWLDSISFAANTVLPQPIASPIFFPN